METIHPVQTGAFTTSQLLFECTIEVDKHTSLKNTKRIGRNGMYTDAKVKRRQEFLVLALSQRARRVLLDKPIGCTVWAVWDLEFDSYWTKTKPIRLNRKAGDLSNSIQACEDALIKAGVIEDDSLIVGMTAVKKPSTDGINRIGVKLYELG